MRRRTNLWWLVFGILFGGMVACLCRNTNSGGSRLENGEYRLEDPSETPYSNVALTLESEELVIEMDTPSSGSHVVLVYELVASGVR